MDYLTIREICEKWGVGTRIVTQYCNEGRIPDTMKKGNLWLIPENAAKPEDKRRKKAPAQSETETPFQPLTENKDLFVEIIRHFPYPMHISAPDGLMLFANDAFFQLLNVSDPPKDLRKHNMLHDPNLEKWGIKDFVLRAFQGEIVSFYDSKVPLQEFIVKYGGNAELLSESMFVNITAFPIYDENHQIAYIVAVFITSRYYQGREEVIKGREYIDEHWKEEFDSDVLSGIVHMSRHHYTRLFKQHTGMTPHHYYQTVKLGKLKEMLCDSNLSIAQVFDECGVDYNGNLAKKLKQELGMTPSEYRAVMTRK